MEIGLADVASYLWLLAEAPRRIAATTDGVDSVRLHLRTADEPWSVNDILAHLRASADVRERFIEDMLTLDRPVLRYVSPRSFLRKTNYLEVTFGSSFQAYETQRARLLRRLDGLPIDAWSRSATIRDRAETVATYVHFLTSHETVHCDQIESLLRER
jgi:hypothetical protein